MIPGYLIDTYEKRLHAARLDYARMYNEYWQTLGSRYKLEPCYVCGKRCKVELDSMDKYDARCLRCGCDSWEQIEAENLADQMGVC